MIYQNPPVDFYWFSTADYATALVFNTMRARGHSGFYTDGQIKEVIEIASTAAYFTLVF